MQSGERTTRQLERAIIHSVVDQDNLRDLLKFSRFYPNSPSLDEGIVNVNAKVIYRYKNYGRTPGVIKEISHHLLIANILPTKPTYSALDTIFRSNMISPGNDTEQFECKLVDHPKMKTTNEIVRGQNSIWFYGRIIYNDIFGGEHEHRFCWYYHGGSYGFRPYYKNSEYNKNT